MRPRSLSSLVVVAVVAVVAALAACDAGFDGAVFPTLPPARELAVTKELVVSVASAPLRFRVPVRVSPPSFDARVEVAVQDASRPLRVEVTPEQFAGSAPETWALVGTDGVAQTFLSGVDTEDLRLSLAHDDADVADPIAVRLALRLVAPSDIDFDGIADGVAVSFDPLTPLPQ
jgi:hypothetical protein